MSNTIYSQKNESKKFHYTYQITELSTNRKYIGVRSSNILPEEDIGIKYFSSSSNKEFIKNQKENPSNYKYEVLIVFDTREEASDHEIELHEKYDVSRNNGYFNKINAKFEHRFGFAGYVVVIDSENINKKPFLTRVDDPDFISKKLISCTKGKVNVKDKDGNTFQVSKDDPRYLSGELVAISKNQVLVKNKDGNIFRVSINDPRYLSGELVGIAKGKITVKDKDGNIFRISNDDPRYLSGELEHVSKGLIMINDGVTSKYQDRNLPIPDGWVKGRAKK